MLSMSKDNKLKDKIVEHIYKEFPDTRNVNQLVRAVLVLVDEARANSEEYKEPPAIPQLPQGEICSDNLCDYCEHFIDKPSVWCSERCTDCDNFKGRKLSPVR